jgi:uncharacterized protein VirK/YbjX
VEPLRLTISYLFSSYFCFLLPSVASTPSSPHRSLPLTYYFMLKRLTALWAQPAYQPKDRLKIAIGALIWPGATQTWLDYVDATPLLREAVVQVPKLITKIYRPFLCRSYGCAERVAVLKTHYLRVQDLDLTALTQRALIAPQILYQGHTKSESTFDLRLSATQQGHREGEFCLSLIYQDHSLFELNCTLGLQDGRTCLRVGRLQGTSQPEAQQLVRQATSDLHACRPANLMLHAARNLAAIWQCDSVLLVANRQRIALNLWRRFHITANYDKTWLEAGATLRADGWYSLEPLAEKDIDLSEIASKKRAEAKRRQALLNGVYAGLLAALRSSQKTSSA